MISGSKQVPRDTRGMTVAEIAAWELAQVKKLEARRQRELEKDEWQRREAERRDWQPAAGPEEEGE